MRGREWESDIWVRWQTFREREREDGGYNHRLDPLKSAWRHDAQTAEALEPKMCKMYLINRITVIMKICNNLLQLIYNFIIVFYSSLPLTVLFQTSIMPLRCHSGLYLDYWHLYSFTCWILNILGLHNKLSCRQESDIRRSALRGGGEAVWADESRDSTTWL